MSEWDRLRKLLTVREREVLLRYYGLRGRRPEKQSVIGRSLGVTRQQVHKNLASGLGKIAAAVPRRATALLEPGGQTWWDDWNARRQVLTNLIG